jgi:hypothetical protein
MKKILVVSTIAALSGAIPALAADLSGTAGAKAGVGASAAGVDANVNAGANAGANANTPQRAAKKKKPIQPQASTSAEARGYGAADSRKH